MPRRRLRPFGRCLGASPGRSVEEPGRRSRGGGTPRTLPLMKRLAVPILATALLLGAPTAVSADLLEGFWPEPSTLSTTDAYGPDIAVSADGQRQAAIWTVYKPNDHRVPVATSADAGATWTAATDLASTGQPLGNTSIVSSDNGQRLTAAWFENSEVHVRQSADAGNTWSAMVNLSPTFIHPPVGFLRRRHPGDCRVDGGQHPLSGLRVHLDRQVGHLVDAGNRQPRERGRPVPVRLRVGRRAGGDGNLAGRVEPPARRHLHERRPHLARTRGRLHRRTAGPARRGPPAADGSRIVATWVEGDDGFTVPNHVASSYTTDAGQTWSAPQALPAMARQLGSGPHRHRRCHRPDRRVAVAGRQGRRPRPHRLVDRRRGDLAAPGERLPRRGQRLGTDARGIDRRSAADRALARDAGV